MSFISQKGRLARLSAFLYVYKTKTQVGQFLIFRIQELPDTRFFHFFNKMCKSIPL